LGQLPYGTAIVKIFQTNPIKTPLTPYYKTPEFDKTVAQDEYVRCQPFDEEKVFYDIKSRNAKMLKRNKPDFDSFGF